MPHTNEVSYPVQPPIACFTNIVQILRNGEAVTRRAELGLDIWNVQGFGQMVFLGLPDTPGPFMGDTGDEDELADAIREAVAEGAKATGQSFGQDFGAMDWRALLKFFLTNIAPLIIPLILDQKT